MNLPGAQIAGPTQAAIAKHKPGRIEIVGHRVRGTMATITIQVPAAGRLTIAGGGVRSSTRTIRGARRVTLKVALTRAGTASLHRHRGRLKIRLKASFKPTSGTGSTTAVTVTFT